MERAVVFITKNTLQTFNVVGENYEPLNYKGIQYFPYENDADIDGYVENLKTKYSVTNFSEIEIEFSLVNLGADEKHFEKLKSLLGNVKIDSRNVEKLIPLIITSDDEIKTNTALQRENEVLRKKVEELQSKCSESEAIDKNQETNTKQGATRLPSMERVFCRIFRPSFFGGYDINDNILYGFIGNFLSLSRALTEDEIAQINRAFDTLCNNAIEEYELSIDHSNFEFSADKITAIDIENEVYRYDFLSDDIFDTMKLYYKSSGALGTKHFSNVWLFALLAAFDGNYSPEKIRFFRRMKKLFPVTPKEFIKSFIPNTNFHNDVKTKSFISYLFKYSDIKNLLDFEVNYNGNITYMTENGEKNST